MCFNCSMDMEIKHKISIMNFIVDVTFIENNRVCYLIDCVVSKGIIKYDVGGGTTRNSPFLNIIHLTCVLLTLNIRIESKRKKEIDHSP